MPAKYRLEFDSLDEAVLLADRAEEVGKWQSTYGMSSRKACVDEGWSGTVDWTSAYHLAMNGWDEGTQKLADLREQLMDELGRVLPEPRGMMDVSGFEVDPGAFANGAPDHMVSVMQLEGQSKQFHIVTNISVPGHMSTQAMMLRGLLVAGLVDALEHMGHRVRLDVVSLTNSEHNGVAVVVHMKHEQDSLDLQRLVFACAHPAMLRRIEFALLESLPEKARDEIGVTGGGYGRASDDTTLLLPGEEGDIYIGNTDGAANMEQTMEMVMEWLRRGGVLREEPE